MISNCQQIYQSLLGELEELKKRKLSFTCEIEYGFQASYLHWNQVFRFMAGYQFQDLQEEIRFFKEIKPLFTSHIAYFNLLYHSQLFRPDSPSGHIIRFWQRENQRLGRFIKDHADFYVYYKSGCTCNDQLYFTRNCRERIHFNTVLPYADHHLESSHDPLLAQLLALEKYVLYTHKVLWWL